MTDSHIIPHLTKLLKNLIFKNFDLEFNITVKEDYYGEMYILTITLDPEVMCMSGDDYNPESTQFLYDLEDNIFRVLPYVGLDESNLIVKFEYINEQEFSNKLVGMVNGILPKLYNRIDGLPKLVNLETSQRGDMSEFRIGFQFNEVPKIGQINKLYDNIHDLLPTFEDVYMDFGLF
jgi:hypothetical protein